MKVEILKQEHREAFDLLSRAEGNAFSSPEWLNIYGDSLQRCGIFDDNGKLIGGFVLQLSKKGGIRLVKSPPFMPHNALFYNNISKNPAAVNGFHKKVFDAIIEFFKSLSPAVLSCSFPGKYIDYQPFVWANYKVVPRYTYLLDLELSEEELWQNMAGERRNDMKKAEKDQVTFKFNDDHDVVMGLIMNSFQRNKAGVADKPVDEILRKMSASGHGYSVTTWWQERPVATAYCITDKDTSFYILGGYDEVHRHKGAGALALWKSITHAKSLGLKVFDFEGSMIPAVEHYFRGFGGRIVPFYTVNKAPFLLECGLKLMKRSHF
jgi:hypothetical protein